MEDEGDIADSSEKGEEVRPVRLSLHLIVKRHLPSEAETWSQEQVIESLNKINRLRLDRENIGQIDSLELLGSNVSFVYLQHNRITSIQNLDCLPNLKFLTLAGNRICTVENLRHLNQLTFLDLSDNKIDNFEIDEFPQLLIILNLSGNPCCSKPDYRMRTVQELSSLKQLDGEAVSKMEKLEVGIEISSDEDEEEVEDFESSEDEPDPSLRAGTSEVQDRSFGAYRTKLPDIEVRLQDMTNELLLRSQNRLEDCLQVHRRHAMEIQNLRLKNKSLKFGGKSPSQSPSQ